MPICVYQQQRLHFTLEGERGPFVVFYPPALASLNSWYRKDYIPLLESQFRLIFLDPFGQGRSDSPSDPALYTIESRVEQVIQLMNDLHVDSLHFVGIGLGGQVGFAMAHQASYLLRSMTLVGAHPFPLRHEINRFKEHILLLQEGGITAYIQRIQTEMRLSEVQKIEILQYSAEAQILILEKICEWGGVEDLSSIKVPTLLFTETNEEKFLLIREAGRTLSSGRYLILPRLQYEEGVLTSGQLVPPLLDFINRNR